VLTPTVGDDGVPASHAGTWSKFLEVRERASSPRRALPADFDDGATTAAVFEMFAQAIAPDNVVIERRSLPLPSSPCTGRGLRFVIGPASVPVIEDVAAAERDPRSRSGPLSSSVRTRSSPS
jgi:hypothetical protein